MNDVTPTEEVAEEETAQQGPYGLAILLELNRSKHIYEGTVLAAEKARRRARNKVARKARRVAR